MNPALLQPASSPRQLSTQDLAEASNSPWTHDSQNGISEEKGYLCVQSQLSAVPKPLLRFETAAAAFGRAAELSLPAAPARDHLLLLLQPPEFKPLLQKAPGLAQTPQRTGFLCTGPCNPSVPT